MSKVILSFAFALGLVFPVKAIAAEWVLVADSQNAQLFVDADTVRRQSHIVYFWQRTVFTQPRQGIALQTAYVTGNCRTLQSRTRTIISYDATGKQIAHDELGDRAPLDSPVPGTFGEASLSAVCRP